METLWTDQGRITCLAISPDNSLVAFGGFSQTLFMFSLEENRLISKVEMNKGIIRSIKFHPSKNYISIVDDSGSLSIVNNDDYKISSFSISDSPLYSIDFSLDGKEMVLCGKNGFCAIAEFDYYVHSDTVSKKKMYFELPYSTEEICFCVTRFPKKSRLSIIGTKGINDIWNLENKSQTKIPGLEETGFCSSINRSENLMAVGCASGLVKVWDLNTGHFLELYGHSDAARWVCFHPIKDNLLISGSKDKKIFLWNIDDSSYKILDGHEDYIYQVEFTGNGKEILSCSGDGTLRKWYLSDQ